MRVKTARLLRAWRAAGMLFVGTCVLSCSRDEIAERASLDQLPLASGAPQDTIVAVLAAQQRELLRLLSDTAADPTPYLAPSFMLMDWHAPRESPDAAWLRRIDPQGRSRMDYFKLLATRLAAERAEAGELEVLPQRGGSVVVIAYHSTVPPTVTRWTRVDDSWQVLILTLNAPPDAVRRLRQDAIRRAN